MKKQNQVTWEQNTYSPALSVCDQKRKQWFTNYNMELMQEIRRIKLNEDGKEGDSNK